MTEDYLNLICKLLEIHYRIVVVFSVFKENDMFIADKVQKLSPYVQ